jgi:DNA polymerase-1
MEMLDLFGNPNDTNCSQCGLRTSCVTPKMPVHGNGKKQVLIVNEYPGSSDDSQGIPLIGKAGQFLRKALLRYGFDIDRDAWKINAVNCHISNGGTPSKIQLQSCWPYVRQTIEKLKPKFIWTLGQEAINAVTEFSFAPKTTINTWRGLSIYDHKLNAWVLPLLHPNQILRQEKDLNLQAVFNMDVANAIKSLHKMPKHRVIGNFHLLYDFEEIIELLDGELEWAEEIYFDYETTGLKAFRPGHKIVCIAFSSNGNDIYTFPLEYRDHFNQDQIRCLKHAWKSILECNRIKKSAHNLRFEDNWSRLLFDCSGINWNWDSQLAAHVLDCRHRMTGLKFQAYLNFGERPYNEDIEPFLRADDSHSLNNVMKIPLRDLLEYNCKDVLYGMNLMWYQKAQIERDPHLQKGYKLFHEGNLTFADMQMNGMFADEEHYEQQRKEIGQKIKELENELKNSKEAGNFLEIFGRPINLNSHPDIRALVYDIMKQPKEVLTETGEGKADKNVLAEMDIPFLNKLLELRKYEKLHGTYISQITREICNGKINPFFDLAVAVSYRSSSSCPNFTNFPKRDKEIQKVVRSGLKPSPGNKLIEADYGQIEVRGSASYHKDPNMINYILDTDTDMHRDTSSDIFILTHEDVSKEIRGEVKNKWVFAQFYGSYYKNCAIALWKNCLDLKTVSGVVLSEHLASHGIMNYQQFEEHCRKVEDVFWNERFAVYKQWKLEMEQFFRNHGYIELHTGFYCTGLLGQNECSNYNIQGSSFHCLLWTLIQLNKRSKEEGWKSKIIGQIHDAIVIDLYPPEQDRVIESIEYFGTQKIREEFTWIAVPLKMEYEITEIDEPWFCKKEIEIEVDAE